MKYRTIEVKVRLNEKEARSLNERVRKSRLSREAYLRHLINGYIPREAPPPDYFAMMKELYRIGTNLNQIAKKAHALNVIDTEKYDEGIAEFKTAVKSIMAAVVLPQPYTP